MESATSSSRKYRPRALDAQTLTEAFQMTAQDHADRPAVRTKDDAESYTWAEYADMVEELARGISALGVEPGHTVGSMLTNRPEFHFFDTAVMHLGATPFSLYNTYTAEQISYLVEAPQPACW